MFGEKNKDSWNDSAVSAAFFFQLKLDDLLLNQVVLSLYFLIQVNHCPLSFTNNNFTLDKLSVGHYRKKKKT